MNFTQNDRLSQVTTDTLVVGVDIGSQDHYARGFNWRGFEFSKGAFNFNNTRDGFLTFLRWLDELKKKQKRKRLL